MSPGYIYIRTHPAYTAHGACKLGKASNIPERDSQYATGELKRGTFALVIEFDSILIAGIVEKLLQRYFTCKGFHILHDGGTEFYKQEIIHEIIPYLEKTNINYHVLTEDEINSLTRTLRLRNVLSQYLQQNTQNTSDIQNIQNTRYTQESTEVILTDQSYFTPRPYQTDIITKAFAHLQLYAKGLLILTCGVGKTLISLWIALQIIMHFNLSQNISFTNSIIIGVPNISLLKQWHNTITKLLKGNIYILTVSSGISESEIGHYLTQTKQTKQPAIVLTSYSSAHKVNTAARVIKYIFDIKILDEAHHLTTYNMAQSNTCKTYIQMLNIPSVKQLALTATIKQIEPNTTDNGLENIISNDNVQHFGEIIDRKCLLWAIQQNIVCDYVIQTIVTDAEQLNIHFKHFNITDDTDKRMFLSAYAALKSIIDRYSHHLLIYANSKENIQKIINYIKLLLDNKYFTIAQDDIFYSNYHSDMNVYTQTNILKQYENTKYGIISCVYCLGEGWDFPLVDGEVYSENMSSNIRIVQSALRANRKYLPNPGKIAKIILPILFHDDWFHDENNQDLRKVREVIYQMGLEDETIASKIKVRRITITHDNPELHDIPVSNSTSESCMPNTDEYDEELTRRLLLKTTNRAALGITYEKARRIIADKGIKSKADYYALCARDIRLTHDPETFYKSQFTNWIDYLSIPRIYYNLETCRTKINEYLTENKFIDLQTHYLDLAFICEELCKIDTLFPPVGLWTDYYNVKDLHEFIEITPKKKKKLTNLIL